MSEYGKRINIIKQQFPVSLNWEDKYSLIVTLGRQLAPMDESKKIDLNLVKGCQSQVWLHAEYDELKKNVRFQGDSDALIVKGLVALVLNIFNNLTPDEIINGDLIFLEEIGLKAHLTPSRANGLNSMIKQIKNYALVFKLTKT